MVPRRVLIWQASCRCSPCQLHIQYGLQVANFGGDCRTRRMPSGTSTVNMYMKKKIQFILDALARNCFHVTAKYAFRAGTLALNNDMQYLVILAKSHIYVHE